MARNNKLFLTIGIIVLLAMGVGAIFYYQTSQVQITSSTFVNPDWARLECAPTDSLEGKDIFFTNNNQIITCGINENTETCRLTLKNTCTTISCLGTFGTARITINNIEYKLTPGGTKIINMKAGDTWTVKHSFGSFASKIEIAKEWKPWKLYRFVGGAKWIVNSNNCDITSGSKGFIRQKDYPGSKLFRTGGEGTKWINYVNAWNYGPATNVFRHSQYGEVYCNAAQIFDIVELRMENNKLVKVNPEYRETLPDGDFINGQGSKLENVECCPNEPNCGDDFTYKQTKQSCFTDSQCFNAGGPFPISKTSYVKYVCESSLCEQKGPFTVECTTNAACSNGQICDLSTTNYGKCITQIGQDYCGDETCGLNENEKNCPVDCFEELECKKWYQDSFTRIEKDYGPLYWRFFTPFVGPIETPESGCKTSGWIYMVGIGIFALLIIMMILYIPNKGVIAKKK